MRNFARRFRSVKGEGGQALIEFAMVLPILLLLIVGIISYGLYINANVSLQQAARVGAREASLGTTLGCPGDSAKTQIVQDNSSATIYGVVDDQINQSVGLSTWNGSTPKAILTPAPTISTSTSNGVPSNGIVTVTVSMTYNPVVPMPGLLPPTIQITQAYTMMMEGSEPSNATTSSGQPQNTVKLVSTSTCG